MWKIDLSSNSFGQKKTFTDSKNPLLGKAILITGLIFSAVLFLTCSENVIRNISVPIKSNEIVASQEIYSIERKKPSSESIVKSYYQSNQPHKFGSSRKLIGSTYNPGNLTVQENGLLLSEGLTSRIIAISGQPVKLVNGSNSTVNFHFKPDAGATYEGPNGTWMYVSNSEMRYTFDGGVGAFTFNSDGDVIDFQMVLSNTRANCGGGKTSWDVSVFSASL
jgi:hypothetical protein